MVMEIKPTESELEILQVLWSNKTCTVREVNELLSESKGIEIGYTTTLKLMQIMFDKGLVSRDASSRTHIYSPNVSQESTRGNILDKLINGMFNGSASQLVIQALNNQKSSKEEIDAIKKYLAQLDKID